MDFRKICLMFLIIVMMIVMFFMIKLMIIFDCFGNILDREILSKNFLIDI